MQLCKPYFLSSSLTLRCWASYLDSLYSSFLSSKMEETQDLYDRAIVRIKDGIHIADPLGLLIDIPTLSQKRLPQNHIGNLWNIQILEFCSALLNQNLREEEGWPRICKFDSDQSDNSDAYVVGTILRMAPNDPHSCIIPSLSSREETWDYDEISFPQKEIIWVGLMSTLKAEFSPDSNRRENLWNPKERAQWSLPGLLTYGIVR